MSFYRPGPRTVFAALPGGVEGIKRTLAIMGKLVRQWKSDPGIRELTLELTAHLPQGDYTGEVVALHAFVRDRIRYVGDTSEVETVHTPRRVLEQAAGDCDDKSVLLATLLEAINHKTRFAAGAFQAPEFYTHVWVETLLGRAWYPLETTKGVPPGWYPPGQLHTPLYWHN